MRFLDNNYHRHRHPCQQRYQLFKTRKEQLNTLTENNTIFYKGGKTIVATNQLWMLSRRWRVQLQPPTTLHSVQADKRTAAMKPCQFT